LIHYSPVDAIIIKEKYDFYLIAHEHLYVFRKPEKDEKIRKFKYSMIYW
jgi:hypothetical protein